MPRIGTVINSALLAQAPNNPWARERRNGTWLWVPKDDRFLKLSAKAKSVYLALAARSRRGGEWIYVKQARISKDLGGVRGLRSALKELAFAGYVVVVPQYRQSAIYLLTDPEKVESQLWGVHGHPRGQPLLGHLAKHVVGKRARWSLNTAPDHTLK